DNLEGCVSKVWPADPWAGGAGTQHSPGQLTTLGVGIERPEGRVHFAGEHTSGQPYWMQGALQSGLRAAKEVQESDSVAGYHACRNYVRILQSDDAILVSTGNIVNPDQFHRYGFQSSERTEKPVGRSTSMWTRTGDSDTLKANSHLVSLPGARCGRVTSCCSTGILPGPKNIPRSL